MKNKLNRNNIFLNPENDSIDSVVQELLSAHKKILSTTDLSKGAIPSDLTEYQQEISNFTMPEYGMPEDNRSQIIADLFRGVPRWHSPKTMYNVAPTPVLQTVIAKFLSALYNPNLVLDVSSGESTLTEQKVIKAIAEYIGWDWHTSGGVFTFGGKATTMYGIKLGIKKCSPEYSEYGQKDDLVVISTKTGHPSHVSDCEWMGIGSKNVFRVDVDGSGRVDLFELEFFIRRTVSEGKKIAAIILTGGTTNNMTVDPIFEAVDLRDRLVSELQIGYYPHIHIDAVVGFPWIFFKGYDFDLNELEISKTVINKIKTIYNDLKYINRADSFGIDFHKMGFCPYISSLFMVKDKKPFTGWKDNFVKYGQNSPFTYTMENSRPADGPNSAFIVLNVLGEKGFQEIIAQCMESAEDLRHKIAGTNQFRVVNEGSLGNSIIFEPLIPGSNSFEDFQDEKKFRDLYVLQFLEVLKSLGNPYFIDKVPANATGGVGYPFHCLKAYMMSPYSSAENNTKFINFMVGLKSIVDKNFVFDRQNESGFDHPLI